MILEPLDPTLVRWVRMHDRGSAVSIENIGQEGILGITVLFSAGDAPSGRDRQYTHLHLDRRSGPLIAPGASLEFSPDGDSGLRASVQAVIDSSGHGFGPDRRNALGRVIAEQQAEAHLIEQLATWAPQARDAELLRLSGLAAAPQDALQFALRQLAERLRIHATALGMDPALKVLVDRHSRQIRVTRSH